MLVAFVFWRVWHSWLAVMLGMWLVALGSSLRRRMAADAADTLLNPDAMNDDGQPPDGQPPPQDQPLHDQPPPQQHDSALPGEPLPLPDILPLPDHEPPSDHDSLSPASWQHEVGLEDCASSGALQHQANLDFVGAHLDDEDFDADDAEGDDLGAFEVEIVEHSSASAVSQVDNPLSAL